MVVSIKDPQQMGAVPWGRKTSIGNGQSALGLNWEPSREFSKVWEAAEAEPKSLRGRRRKEEGKVEVGKCGTAGVVGKISDHGSKSRGLRLRNRGTDL